MPGVDGAVPCVEWGGELPVTITIGDERIAADYSAYNARAWQVRYRESIVSTMSHDERVLRCASPRIPDIHRAITTASLLAYNLDEFVDDANALGAPTSSSSASCGIFNHSDATAVEVGCHAHARRPFAELAHDGDARAAPIIDLYQKLYQVEARASEEAVDADERLRRRREYSAPIIDAIVAGCVDIRERHPPTDPLCKAAGYVLNQERALRRFLEDGRLPLDNTLMERRLRPVAMGRRNYLLAGSDAGAERAAIRYSLAGRCALVGVAPRAYLIWALEQISDATLSHVSDRRALAGQLCQDLP